MKSTEFLEALDRLVAERHLLKHPFYVLWTEGKLTREDLRRYAVAYYPQVANFPRYVSGVHAALRRRGPPPGAAREPDRRGARRAEPSRPVASLRGVARRGFHRSRVGSFEPRGGGRPSPQFLETTRTGSVAEGLAALYAYESQIPEISRSKREGLAAFYGIGDSEATRFFTVHEQADVWHRQVEREALGRIADNAGGAGAGAGAASRCLDALNRALDGVMREIGRA